MTLKSSPNQNLYNKTINNTVTEIGDRNGEVPAPNKR